jgi:hypothetical protein
MEGWARILWAMSIVLICLVGLCSCAGLFTEPAAQQELAELNADLADMKAKFDSGDLTAAEFKAAVGRIQDRINTLQTQGYSIWEILGGIAGSLLLGAFGLNTGKGLNIGSILGGLAGRRT